MKTIPILAVLIMYAATANAYIGPGMAGGIILAVLGVIGSIFLALFAILYYPIKRAFKKRKNNKDDANEIEEDIEEENDQSD